MKKALITSLIFLSCVNTSWAQVTFKIKNQKSLKQLNVEEEKLDLNSKEISGQYKGELKHPNPRRKDEFRWYEARVYGGLGLRYSSMSDTKMTKEERRTDAQIQAETGQVLPVYYDENKLSFGADSGFFGSAGLYWRNGLRLEFEYAQTKYESSKLGQFTFTTGSDEVWEYLHNNTINVNTKPVSKIEFDVKTMMFNVLYEPFKYDSKITPYIGAGAGIVISDIETLPNDGTAKAFGWQAMTGLAYQMGSYYGGGVYLGYRYIQSGDLEQTFTRVVQVSGASPNYTPYTIQSTETYKYKSHNIDLGFRFFF